jgi:hypothetical protein
MRPLLAALLGSLVVGCGGTVSTPSNDATVPTDSSSDGASPGDTSLTLPDGAPFDYCKALSERATKCGASFDAVKCARDQGCASRALKPADANAYLGCLATRDCATAEDTCLSAAAAKYTTDPTAEAYSKACLDTRATCTSGATYSNDLCGVYHGMLVPDALAKLRACFDKPCAEAKTCYDTVIASYGCN